MSLGILAAEFDCHPVINNSGYPSLNKCDWGEISSFSKRGWATTGALDKATEDEDCLEWSASWCWTAKGIEITSWNGRCKIIYRYNNTARIEFTDPSVAHIDWVRELKPLYCHFTPLMAVEYDVEWLVSPVLEGAQLTNEFYVNSETRCRDPHRSNVFHTFEPHRALDGSVRVFISDLPQDMA